jgi:CheY-like chemotaxis protein
MAMKIVILEDNADRQAVMRACLADRFYTFDAHFFDDSAEMIRFLEAHLGETILISLDNDLDMETGPDGRSVDCGTGCQVAEFLAKKAPACPVIIHTTNSRAADTMRRELREAGWKTHRVVPFDDTEWIKADWFFAVRRAIVGPVNRPHQLPG